MTAHDEFHLKELEYLRKEIEYRTLDQANVERNVIIALSATYVALATVDPARLDHSVLALKIYFWFIPFLIAVAGAARFADDHYAIRNIARYISELERQFDPAPQGGWERYRSSRKDSQLPWIARCLSWAVLVAGTAAMALILYRLG